VTSFSEDVQNSNWNGVVACERDGGSVVANNVQSFSQTPIGTTRSEGDASSMTYATTYDECPNIVTDLYTIFTI
jgi:hypothetical protein